MPAGTTLTPAASRVDKRMSPPVLAAPIQLNRPATAPTAASTTAETAKRPASHGRGLVEWVGWLTARYELGAVLPACWPLHGALVEELAALHTGWVAVTCGEDQAGLAQWHDLFSRALNRFEACWRTCIDSTHRPHTPASWLETGPQGISEIDLTRDRSRAPGYRGAADRRTG